MSSVGAARIIGPSSSVTFCSPMKKDDSPYIRWNRSSSGNPCQSSVLRELELLREPLLALPQLVQLPVVEQLCLATVSRLEQSRVSGLRG